MVRNGGGVPDDSVVGDCENAAEYLKSQSDSNKKVGIIGTCSGGRQAFLAACRAEGIDAAVNCWGGRIVASEDELTPRQPVAPIDYTEKLSCPLLGIFGNDDHSPTPEQVDWLEEELKKKARDELAKYKVPRIWQFKNQILTNSLGKVLKKEYRDKFIKKMEKAKKKA